MFSKNKTKEVHHSKNLLKNKFMQVFTLTKVKGFFNSGQDRTINAKKNILGSFIFKGGSILCNLAIVPLTINYLNPTKYGIWVTLTSIVSCFSFFDIGLGNGLRNKFAEAVANNDIVIAGKYVSTTYGLFSIYINYSLYNIFHNKSIIKLGFNT